jgi:hypothetical protein
LNRRDSRTDYTMLGVLVAGLTVGFTLYLLLATSCGPITGDRGDPRDEARVEHYRRVAEDASRVARASAPFLPTPLNYIAEGVGLLGAYFGGHHVVRRVRKNRRAKRSSHAPAPR